MGGCLQAEQQATQFLYLNSACISDCQADTLVSDYGPYMPYFHDESRNLHVSEVQPDIPLLFAAPETAQGKIGQYDSYATFANVGGSHVDEILVPQRVPQRYGDWGW